MDKMRKEAEAAALTRTGSAILNGNPIRVIWLPDNSGELGFTDETRTVHLVWNEAEYMDELEAVERTAFRMGVFAHELLHQCLTNFSYTNNLCKKMSRAEAAVFMKFANTLEDPAIEFFAPQVFGGKMLDALRFTIRHIYVKSPGIDESPNAFVQVLNALINFGDMGLVKGHFTFPEAYDYFCKVAPLYNEGITCPDNKRRLDIARKCMEICRPLWEEAVKEEEYYEKLLKELIEALKKNGLNLFGDSIKEMEPDSEAAERRNDAISVLIRSKNAKNGSSEEDSTIGGVPDIIIDLDDDGLSEDPAEKSDENKSSGDGRASFETEDLDADSSASAEGDGSSDSEASKGGSTSGAPDEMSEEDLLKKLSADAETANEIAEETYEITDDMLASIEKSIEAEKNALEKSSTCDAPGTEIPIPSFDISSEAFKSASCKNRKITNSTSSNALYNALVTEFGGEIKHLRKTLERIFEADIDENYRFTSGSYNIKRGTIATSARIFDKKRDKGNTKSVAVMLVVDESGSMSGYKITQARKTAIVFAEALSQLKVPYYIMGFRADSGADAVHDHYVDWTDKKRDRATLAAMEAGGNNFDGYSIRYAAKLLEERPEENRIMFVISDGQPAANRYRSNAIGIKDTINAIKDARKAGTVFGIGLGYCGPTILQEMYGKDFIWCEDPNMLNITLCKKLEKLIAKR